MNTERIPLDPHRQRALDDLRRMIVARFPTAQFAISAGIEDPQETWLTVRVDLDDPDEVMDVVRDRVLHYQIDEGLPLYVLPLRTPERSTALRRELAQARQKASATLHVAPPSR